MKTRTPWLLHSPQEETGVERGRGGRTRRVFRTGGLRDRGPALPSTGGRLRSDPDPRPFLPNQEKKTPLASQSEIYKIHNIDIIFV